MPTNHQPGPWKRDANNTLVDAEGQPVFEHAPGTQVLQGDFRGFTRKAKANTALREAAPVLADRLAETLADAAILVEAARRLPARLFPADARAALQRLAATSGPDVEILRKLGYDIAMTCEHDLLRKPGESLMVGREILVSRNDDVFVAQAFHPGPEGRRSLRYVRTIDGEPVGVVQVASEMENGEEIFVVQNIYVAQAWRRKGVATYLCDFIRASNRLRHAGELSEDGRAFVAAEAARLRQPTPGSM